MTRKVSRVEEYAQSAAEVHRAVTTRQYWVDRVAELDGAGAELVSFEVTGDTTRIVVSKPAPVGRMPAQVAKLIPDSVRLEVTESWGPLTDGVAHAEMVADIAGMPITLAAKFVLKDAGPRSTLDFDGTVDVRVPVLGKAIEGNIATDVGNEVTQIAEYTESWLTRERQDKA
ncbi:DUF2505 domain-containing protein [Nocardia sp. NPDC058058]|uniref:DUF2505 domain-containing protein n=1 Tax=Nocardia sp. NPDC058058 TaxID=3346317 RepID=UPI0036DA70E3